MEHKLRGIMNFRTRFKAVALSVVLVLSQVLNIIGPAVTAYAATPAPDSVTIASSGYLSDVYAYGWTTTNDYTMYCYNAAIENPGHNGETFTKGEPGGIVLDYILFYGYGGAGYTGSVQGYSGQDAQILTQYSVWTYLNSANVGNWRGSSLAGPASAFVDEAKANASDDAAYAGTSYIYTNGSRQPLVGSTLRLFDPIQFVGQKVDSDGAKVSDWDAQGNATTVGTQFTINFYENTLVDSIDQLPSNPSRSWVIQTTVWPSGRVRALLTDDCKVSGDDWYYDDNGAISLPLGTFTVQETKAPTGYKLTDSSVHLGQIKAGTDGYAQVTKIGDWNGSFDQEDSGAGLAVADEIIRGGASFAKIDAERDEAVPQGEATLAGAEITLRNDSSKRVEVNGNWYNPGEDVLTITTSDDGTCATDANALPYGTYTARETKPSNGYLLNSDWSYKVNITEDGTVVNASDTPIEEQIIRGGASFAKIDAERNEAVPEGAATLAGAEITICNESTNSVFVNGKWYQPGEDVITLTTGEDGKCETEANTLPYGKYTAREVKPSKGYLLNSDWNCTFNITDNGTVVDTSSTPLKEQVIRGDMSAVKVDESSMDRMSNVAFLVTSQTTGESHVIVTDENGQFNTAADWNAHTQNTNANDAAYDASTGKVDDSKLDATAGIWFSSNADNATPVDDSLGALPYDTYTIQELPCKANEGHRTIDTAVVITRDAVNIDLGTIDDPTVGIATTLTTDGGEKLAPADSQIKLTDEVAYEGLEKGTDYTLRGELHKVDADGNDQGVIATSEQDFTADLSAGTTTVNFDVDTSELHGMKLVAFEYLYQGDTPLANHEDLTDEGQTVSVPEIHTTLMGDAGHESNGMADTITLTDTIEYKGLKPGDTYVATGTLHYVRKDDDNNVTDGGVVTDADGNDVTAQAEFTPDKADGTVDVTFTFPTPDDLAGQDVVAFEDVTHNNRTVATHADITDENQTMHFPKVHTTATDKVDGDQEIEAAADQVVTDRVEYTNLTPGQEYTVTGTLHLVGDDGSDAGVLNNEVTNTVTFTPDKADGYVDVEFTVDASQLGGKSVVAFEDVTRDGVSVATHTDITDEGQTVTVKTPPTPETPPTTQTPPPETPETPETPTTPMPNTGQTPLAAILIVAGIAAVSIVAYRRHTAHRRG